ncbi:MAG: CDP-alcohol phosphatidyltransferase family protein [Acidimicrobiia bacterium]|nr:CDP-alcohol phosphatidyltransferase family protein [Acidimicrobiia bacterium]
MNQRARASSRVLTVPNVITLLRLLLVPVFLWLLLGHNDGVAAAILLGVLGATDWVDGYIARHFDQESELGRIIDPIADRVLLFAAVIGLLIDGSAPRWILLLVLVRELFVTIAVLALAAAGARRIDVIWAGKAGTFALMFGLPMFLLAESTTVLADLWLVGAWCFSIGGLALSLWSAALYVPAALEALREGRDARTGVGSE